MMSKQPKYEFKNNTSNLWHVDFFALKRGSKSYHKNKGHETKMCWSKPWAVASNRSLPAIFKVLDMPQSLRGPRTFTSKGPGSQLSHLAADSLNCFFLPFRSVDPSMLFFLCGRVNLRPPNVDPPRKEGLIRPYQRKPMVNNDWIRPYFPTKGGRLTSHKYFSPLERFVLRKTSCSNMAGTSTMGL